MNPAPTGSVTIWLDRLKSGDPAAAQPLWDRYFDRLVAAARSRLRHARRAAADEEDVIVGVFDSVWRAAKDGRFPQLHDRQDLWQVLLMLTRRKSAGLIRHENCGKRDPGRVIPGSAPSETDSVLDLLAAAADGGPTPEFAAEVADECNRLLDLLGEGELRTVAVAKMEGYTNEEIARKIGRSVPTVERKLALIRATWRRSVPE